MELENSLIIATTSRGIKRSEAIEQTATLFYNFLKDGKYTQFNKSLFLSFMPEGIKERTRERITKEVFKLLIDAENITKTKTTKNYIALRNKNLSSNDYNSYNLLMAKNGYKVGYYKYEYDQIEKIPRRVKVGESRINGFFGGDYDHRELISNKPRSKQAVYTTSPFSVIKHIVKHDITTYKVN